MSKESSVSKLGNGKRIRTTEEWLRAQGTDPVKQFRIMPSGGLDKGKVLEGWVNMKTGKRILTCLRRVREGELLSAGVRRIGKKLGLLVN